MDTLVSPIDESRLSTPVVDDILNSAREYIYVLQSLAEAVLPPSATICNIWAQSVDVRIARPAKQYFGQRIWGGQSTQGSCHITEVIFIVTAQRKP